MDDDGDERLMECGDGDGGDGAVGCPFLCAFGVEDASGRLIQIAVAGIVGWWSFAWSIEPSLDR